MSKGNKATKPAVSMSVDEALENKLKKKKRKKRKTALIVISVILALLLAFAGGMFAWYKLDPNGFLSFAYKTAVWLVGDEYFDMVNYDDGNSQWSEFPEDDDEAVGELNKPEVEAPTPDDLPEYEIIDGMFDGNSISDEYEKQVYNILLIGADTLDGNSARSDTMILMSLNTVKNRLTFTSFMRDSYVELPGRGYNRLNAAHSRGGPQYLIETLEYNFGIDIDCYAKVDFTSFKGAIDAIGGIDLTVNEVNYNYFYDWDGIEGLTQAEACNGSHTVHLNGDQALMYARTRKGDRVENGDFGRTLHQRDFLSQFVNNCKDASIGELDSVLKTLLPYIVTDMARSDLENHVYDLMEYVSYDMSDARVPCAGSWEYYKTPKGAEVVNINVPANAAYVKAKIYG